jgi:hypothetical protein
MTAGIKANVDGSAAIQVGGTDVIGLSSTGNINFPISGQRITGDFSNATIANRVMFQTSTVNGNTILRAIPNGTGTIGAIQAGNSLDPNNQASISINAMSAECSISSQINGTGTYLPMTFYTGGSERMRIDTSGNLQFNSGYGSVATAYGCRAWVNFDGTSNTANLSGTYSQSGTTVTVTATAHGLIAGNVVYSDITTGTAVDGTYTVATVISSSQFTYTAGTSLTTSGNVTLRRNTIRASGNVSSVADNAVGNYTVNFTTAMPDINYSAVGSANTIGGSAIMVSTNSNGAYQPQAPTTTACQLQTTSYVSNQDCAWVSLAFFR